MLELNVVYHTGYAVKISVPVDTKIGDIQEIFERDAMVECVEVLRFYPSLMTYIV